MPHNGVRYIPLSPPLFPVPISLPLSLPLSLSLSIPLSLVLEELPSFEDHLHSLFKVVHVGPISTGIQSLLLLHQVMESRQSVSERYYNALYSKLLDPALRYCHRQVCVNRNPYTSNRVWTSCPSVQSWP